MNTSIELSEEKRKEIGIKVLKKEIRDQKISNLFVAVGIIVPLVLWVMIFSLIALSLGLIIFLLLFYFVAEILSEETSFRMQMPSVKKLKELKSELKAIESG